MTEEDSLRQQVHWLRVRLAHAEEQGAEHLKHTAQVGIAVVLFGWALLSSVFEALSVSGAFLIVAPPLLLLFGFWWMTQRRHERLKEALAEAIRAAREAGYAAEIAGSWVTISKIIPTSAV